MNSAMNETVLDHARTALKWQVVSAEKLSEQLDSNFLRAVHSVATAGKVLTTGLGKSGFIARKMAATLTSVRVPGIFLHPVEAMHGDSGIMQSDDCVVAFSKSGETAEVIQICRLAKELGATIVAITSRSNSSLAQLAHTSVHVPIEHEMDSDDLLPTTSTTCALIVADIIAVAAAMSTGDVKDHLSRSHPRGMIGTAMMRTVEEVMHTGSSLPTVKPGDMLVDALAELSAKALGIVCVVDDNGVLAGILTDGDVRRIVVDRTGSLTNVCVDDVMVRTPTTIEPSESLHTALQLMERRERQLSVLPVTVNGSCVGVLRLHDIVRLQVA